MKEIREQAFIHILVISNIELEHSLGINKYYALRNDLWNESYAELRELYLDYMKPNRKI